MLVLQSLAILEPSGSCLPIIQMLKAFDKGTKGTNNDMQMGFKTNGQKVYQTSSFSWPIWMRTQFFPGLLIISCTISILHPSRNGPSYKQAIQQKYLPAPNCFIWRPPSWPLLHRHSADLLTSSCPPGPQILFVKLFSSQPDSVDTWGYSVLEAGLCTCPYPILPLLQFNSIQSRLSVSRPAINNMP